MAHPEQVTFRFPNVVYSKIMFIFAVNSLARQGTINEMRMNDQLHTPYMPLVHCRKAVIVNVWLTAAHVNQLLAKLCVSRDSFSRGYEDMLLPHARRSSLTLFQLLINKSLNVYEKIFYAMRCHDSHAIV